MRRNDKRDFEMRALRAREEMKMREQSKVNVHKPPFVRESEPWKNWFLMIVLASVACKYSFLAGSVILLVYAFYLMYRFEEDEEA